ncbi:Arylsulfatase A [Zobellia uliginosa]|uniref:Arylsulfatase A n=1 Tax=Zobellia uliginosa TaxID=143224 RepID=A0ABY1KNQ3_9FLAO|nr:sulfatase [Zobellia uliginosa]SIS54672.1 Arylsulfatase A [Zobellia uliginosa]
MRKIGILIFSLLCLFGCNNQKKESNPRKVTVDQRPNILWIVAEDLSPVLPSFGDSTVVTPNISRLTAEGVRYTNVFSPSGVCAPSRAAIATGMYQNHIGAQHMRTRGNRKFLPEVIQPYGAMPPADVKMHSEHLRLEGYYCSNNSKEDYQFMPPVTAWDESSKKAHWRNRGPNQPFFSIFNLNVTHESQIWARAKDSLWVADDLDVPVPPYLPNTEVGRNDIRRMYSNVKEMDHQVGEILTQLEEDGLLENTIIFWYADHGGPLPRQKRLLYDSGMKLPLVIRYPGKKNAGTIDDRLISFVDFKPTLLSLAGIQPPKNLDGRAFAGEFESEERREYVYGAADRFDKQYDMIRAVRDNRYKYLKNFRTEQGYYLPVAFREQMPIMQELLRMRDNGELNEDQAQWFRDKKEPEELFDTYNDPYELNNLAGDPQYEKKLKELRYECKRWMQSIGDKGLMPEKEYVASIWPSGTQPKTENPLIEKRNNRIAISCKTDGASIGYQILKENEEIGNVWQVYKEPFSLQGNERAITLAHRIGYLQSNQVWIDGK